MSGGIRGITVEIGGDTTKLGKALSDVNTKSKDLQKELKNVNSLLKMDPGNVTLLTQKQDLLTEAVSNTKKKLDTLKETQKQVQDQFDKGEVTEEQYREFQRAIVATEQKLKSLTDQLKEFGSPTVLEKITNVGNKMKDVGGKIENAGRSLTAVSAVAGGALVGATKTAIDFESAWAGVTKTVDGTENELAEIRQGLLDLSQETASSAVDIAAVAEAAGQLGIKTENILEFTETMVMLGDTTNLSADEAASALAKFANVTSMSADNYGRLGATIVDLGNNFATTEADIVAMATRLASTGEITGLTEAQILALSTALSSAGIEAEAGGSAMAKLLKQLYSTNAEFDTAQKVVASTGYSLRDLQIMQSINGKAFKDLCGELRLTTTELSGYMKSVDQMNKYASTAGVSVEEFKKAYAEDAVGALSLFINGLNETEQNGKSAVEILNEMGLTEVRLSNAVLAMASSGDLMTNAIKTANGAWGENSALTAEAEKRYSTTASQLTQLKNTITELGVKLGEILLPIVQGLIEKLSGVVEWLTNLSPAAQTIILIITTVVASLAPLLIGIGALIGSIGTIMTYAPMLVTAFNAVKGAFAAFNAVLAANPIGLIITAIGALVAAFIYLWNNCDAFRQFWIDLWEKIKQAFAAVVEWIKATAPKIAQFFVDAWDKIKSCWSAVTGYFSNIWTNIKSVFSGVGEWFGNIFRNAWTAVKNVFSSWGSFFGGLWNTISTKFSTIGTNIANAISGAVKSGINGVISSIESIINSAIGLINGAIGLINQIPGVSIGTIGKLNLPRLARGGIVDRPTLAEIGEDGAEAIIPLEKNTEWLDKVAQRLDRHTSAADNVEVLTALDRIYDRLNRLQIVLDTGTLVGETIDKIDSGLANRQLLNARGV